MSGKLIGILLVGLGLIAGAAMYWLQVYAYYDEVTLAADGGTVETGNQPNRLYRNNGDGTFTDVTRQAGIEIQPTEGQVDDLEGLGWVGERLLFTDQLDLECIDDRP
mgnify:CR=1 FL=1